MGVRAARGWFVCAVCSSFDLGLVRVVVCDWRGLGFVAWFCGLLVGVSVCLNVVCCVLWRLVLGWFVVWLV